MNILLYGGPGVGKSSLFEELASRGYEKGLMAGEYVRKMALELGITLEQALELFDSDKTLDEGLDQAVAANMNSIERGVFDARSSIAFASSSDLRVVLVASDYTAAMRVMADEESRGEIESFESLNEAMKMVAQRGERDRQRLVSWYGIKDPLSLEGHDVAIMTDNLSIKEVADIVENVYEYQSLKPCIPDICELESIEPGMLVSFGRHHLPVAGHPCSVFISEPIVWLVVGVDKDNGRVMLIAKDALDWLPFCQGCEAPSDRDAYIMRVMRDYESEWFAEKEAGCLLFSDANVANRGCRLFLPSKQLFEQLAFELAGYADCALCVVEDDGLVTPPMPCKWWLASQASDGEKDACAFVVDEQGEASVARDPFQEEIGLRPMCIVRIDNLGND